AALQKAAEMALGPRAAECFAAGGRAGGGKAGASLSGSREDKVRRRMDTGAAIGWGAFALERLTPEAMVVVVRRSPFAEAYGPSTPRVCHLIRGVLESLAAVTLAGAPFVLETACAAMGADACRFVTTPKGTQLRAVEPRGPPRRSARCTTTAPGPPRRSSRPARG